MDKALQRLRTNPAPGVFRTRHIIVNSYIVAERETRSWILVDAGLSPLCGWKIKRRAERLFGPGTRPRAIVLTHAHFDHRGGLNWLLRRWDVPVYAHELEMPYLTGMADYPDPDPTVGGGFMAWSAFMYPSRAIDLPRRVHALPDDGSVPGLQHWRWIHTPGHTPGQIALFRDTDRTLIAGDAFVTTNQESFWAVMMQKQEIHGPPTYFTPDWYEARDSVERLADLEPRVAATGHGIPMAGARLRNDLRWLVDNFDEVAIPSRGRYVPEAPWQPALA